MYNAGALRTSGAHRSCQKDPVPHRDLPHPRLEIDRQRAEFTDAAAEDRFNRHHLPERSAQLKISLLFCAAFYVAFGATDVATLGPTTTAGVMVALRVLVALVAGAGLLAITRRPESVRVAVLAACAVEIIGLAVFMVLCWYQPEATAWNALSLGLMVMAIYVNIPNRLVYATLIALAASAAFTLMVLAQQTLRTDDLVAMALLMLLANALGYTGARRYHVAQREAFASALALQQLADRDPLTGCLNRRILQKGALDAEIVRARRYGTPLAVVLCDIDHFKRINDTWGDAAGDQVLRDFATLLQALTRDAIDSVIRYGGGEFLLVLPETELDGAMRLAERIRAAAAATGTILADGQCIPVSASFGATAIAGPHAQGSTTDLLAVADAQLYAARDAGRDCVRGAVVPATQVRARA